LFFAPLLRITAASLEAEMLKYVENVGPLTEVQHFGSPTARAK